MLLVLDFLFGLIVDKKGEPGQAKLSVSDSFVVFKLLKAISQLFPQLFFWFQTNDVKLVCCQVKYG